MTLAPEDLHQITQATLQFIAARLEEVYGAIEQMREEFQQTVSVLDGNDHAVIAELQRMKGAAPAELLREVEESWSHFIKSEAERLGLRVLAAKTREVKGVEVED